VERPSNVARLRHAQERLLRQVLGLVQRVEHAIAVHAQLAAMALDERRERGLVARASRADGGVGVRR
jgi:methyl coenzyme M reductase gamma subunit